MLFAGDKLKHNVKLLAILLILLLLLSACNPDGKIPEGEELGREYYKMDINNNYPIADTLEKVPTGTEARVIILIGQSNATGCSGIAFADNCFERFGTCFTAVYLGT